jgi:chaperone protein EcpD
LHPDRRASAFLSLPDGISGVFVKKFLLIIVCYVFSCAARANVIINSTRVIFPADAKSVSVQLINKSKEQHLVQAWIDDGRQNEKPENISTPFMVVPPVVKIQGNDGQVLRINHNDQVRTLAKDRESLYWLNVLDIPPVPKKLDAAANYMQVAIRSRIKIFWRPAGLKISPENIGRYLSLKRKNQNVCINNASPFYLTAIQLMRWDGKSTRVQQGKKQDNLISKTVSVPPFTCQPLDAGKVSASGGKYQLTYIDDYGSRVPVTIDLVK